MQNHKDIMLAMGFIMPILASIAVGARFTARAIKHAKLGLDDYTILLALVSWDPDHFGAWILTVRC